MRGTAPAHFSMVQDRGSSYWVKGQGPGSGSAGDSPVSYCGGGMTEAPQVPSQELDAGPTTLRLQLPGGREGQTRKQGE